MSRDTIHDRGDEEREGLLARWALGAADPDEARLLREHLATGCAECASRLDSLERVAQELALAAPPRPAGPELRERVLRAAFAATSGAEPGFHFVTADEGEWQPIAPGVERRRLGRDPISRSASDLFRVAPGASVPVHDHAATEHCWVVAGEIRVGDRILRPGDYHRADAGTHHAELRSETGCTFLIVEAPPASGAEATPAPAGVP